MHGIRTSRTQKWLTETSSFQTTTGLQCRNSACVMCAVESVYRMSKSVGCLIVVRCKFLMIFYSIEYNAAESYQIEFKKINRHMYPNVTQK